MCVDLRGRNLNLYTEGKIYTVVDGKFECDNGQIVGEDIFHQFKTFTEWSKFTGSKFKEVKEEETPESFEWYNGKVVCVANHYKDFHTISLFTVGKVYDVIDGYIITDYGTPGVIPCYNLNMLCSVYGNTFVPLQT